MKRQAMTSYYRFFSEYRIAKQFPEAKWKHSMRAMAFACIGSSQAESFSWPPNTVVGGLKRAPSIAQSS